VDLTLEERRAQAAQHVAAWLGEGEERSARATIALPPGPGSGLLFRELAADLAAIGIRLERVEDAGEADLTLVDRVARYGSARWFLNQFNCALDTGLC